jgi:hypothetical protein
MFIQKYGMWAKKGAAPFHPTNLASAVAIWEADVTVEDSGGSFPTDGDEVYKWIDQTSNAYEAERDSSGPLWEETTGVNSAESLVWDASNTDYLVVTGSDSSPLLPSTGDFHVFVVYNYTLDSDITSVFSQGDTGTQNNGHLWIFHRNVGSILRTQIRWESDGTYSDKITTVDASYTGQDVLLELKRSGADMTLIVDGTSGSVSSNASHQVQQDGFVIGGRATSFGSTYTSFFQGNMAAFYVFNSEITGTDYTTLTNYINTKYGV